MLYAHKSFCSTALPLWNRGGIVHCQHDSIVKKIVQSKTLYKIHTSRNFAASGDVTFGFLRCVRVLFGEFALSKNGIIYVKHVAYGR